VDCKSAEVKNHSPEIKKATGLSGTIPDFSCSPRYC